MDSTKNKQQPENTLVDIDEDGNAVCTYYLKKMCTKGVKKCRFSHKPSVGKGKPNSSKSYASGGRVEGPRFCPSSHVRVNDPEKDFFREFKQRQLKQLMEMIYSSYPDLLKGMDKMQEGLFALFNEQTTAELFLKNLKVFLERTESLLNLKEDVLKHLAPVIEINEEADEEEAAAADDADEEAAAAAAAAADDADEEAADEEAADEEAADEEVDEAADDDEEAAEAIKVLFQNLLIHLTQVTMGLIDFQSDQVLAIFKKYAMKPGSFERLFNQLSEFHQKLLKFVKVTTESWDGLNRASIMPPPQNQVQDVIGRYTSINAICSELRARLMHLDSKNPEENKQISVIESMIRFINSLTASAFPIGIMCPPELLDAMAMILEGTTQSVKEAKDYQQALAMENRAIQLRQFDISNIISKASSGDASIKSILFTVSLMFGKHHKVFELFKEKHPSIEGRMVEFFKLLQSKLLKMIIKKDKSGVLESIASDITDDKMFNVTLEKLYMELFTAFEEDVILAEKETLKILKHIKEHPNVFGPLLDFLLSPISGSGGGPLHFKAIDWFMKNMRVCFDDKLTMKVHPTEIIFTLEHGGSNADVSQDLSRFCIKMAVLNSMLVANKMPPFLGNFKSNPIDDDEDSCTIARAVVSAVAKMTAKTFQTPKTLKNFCSQALLSDYKNQYHDCVGTPQEQRKDRKFNLQERFSIFLDSIVNSCLTQRCAPFSMDAVNAKTAILFESVCTHKEHLDALLAIMTSALKLSSTSLKKMHQSICLMSEDNQELLRSLLSFVISPAPESEPDCTGLPFHREIVDTINATYLEKLDVGRTKKIVLDFYKGLSYIMRFVLSNLGPSDVSMVDLMYKKLESFNGDKERRPRHCFPYMTQFMCALLVAMQNYGYSLGDALKCISNALRNIKYRTFTKQESKAMCDMRSNADATAPVDFKKNKAFESNSSYPPFIQILLSDLKSSSDRKCQELEGALDALYLCLASDELTKESTLTLPNMLYSILMGILSQSPKDFFKVYEVEFTTPASFQVGPVDLSIEAKVLALLGPLIKAEVSSSMMEVSGTLRRRDKEDADAAALLTPEDLSDRFVNSMKGIVLDTFRSIIYGMGLLSKEQLSSCESPNAVLALLKEKKTTFLNDDMFRRLLFKIRSYTRRDEEQSKQDAADAAMRKQMWEDRRRQMYSDVEQQDGACAGAEMAVSICQEVPVPVPVSSAELFSLFNPETRELFNMCPPVLLCVDMLVKILTAISNMQNPNAKERRFQEFLKAFECVFNLKTISLAFDDEVEDFTALTPELLTVLSTKFESSYSSSEAYAKSLGIEFTSEINTYIDAVVREFQADIRRFIQENQQFFTVEFC